MGGFAQDSQGYWNLGGGYDISKDYFTFAENNEDVLIKSKNYANVGVVFSSWSKIIYEQTSSPKVSPAHYMGQMLLDMLVPFEYIITESDITDANELLANYKAIILPALPA